MQRACRLDGGRTGAAHRVGEPVTAGLQLRNHLEIQPLAVHLHDHEPRLDGVAGRQVLARADDHPAGRSVGLLREVCTQPPARGAVPDAADDPLGAFLQLLLRARVGVRVET